MDKEQNLMMLTAFALQGLLAGHPPDGTPLYPEDAGPMAVEFAKATLAALEAEKGA